MKKISSLPVQLCVLSLSLLFISSIANAQASRITTASGVRLRTAPQITAEEVVRLPIGTVLQQLEQSASKEKIGQSEDYWYRVSTSDNKSGWVFGSLTAAFDAAKKEAIYQRIASERLQAAEKSEQKNFAEQSDLFNFLTRAISEVTTPATSGELEFSRLQSLNYALLAIPYDKLEQPLYKSWIRAQEKLLVYNEPGGLWMPRADAYWELEKKYRALPVGERLAWAAVGIGLPGECEGFLPCTFEYHLQTDGKYLGLYPQGQHAGDALDNLEKTFDFAIEDATQGQKIGEVPKEDRATFRKQVATMRALITKTTSPKKAAILKKLDQVARLYP